jgi:hypothetical protein
MNYIFSKNIYGRAKSMGFLKIVTEVAAKRVVVNRAFEAGQKGEPPPVYSESEAGRYLQQISDDAYKKGQQSVLVKIGKKLSE